MDESGDGEPGDRGLGDGGLGPDDAGVAEAHRGVVVRPAVGDDLDLLAPLERAAGERHREVGMDEVADHEPRGRDEYEPALADGRLWVAELDGEVVGYVWALDLDGQPHLEQISVLPEASGRGVGIALVEQVVGWAAEQGGSSLTLSTFRDVVWNGPWYRRLGFADIDANEVATDERWRDLRVHEAALGLDIEARTIMRRHLGDAPGPGP